MSINRTDNKVLDTTAGATTEQKQPLLSEPSPRESISMPKKEELVAKTKAAEAEKQKKTYTLWDFTKFTMPFLWKGGFLIRV